MHHDDHDRPHLSIVMPAYNEGQRLGASLSDVLGFLRRMDQTWELIVVNDGSTDDTAAVAGRFEAADDRIRCIHLDRNLGKGNAVRVGVLATRGRQVLMTDADMSTPIDELAALRQAFRPGVAAVIGSRALPGSKIDRRQSRIREALGRMGNRFIRRLTVRGIADTQCGFKLFDGEKARLVFAWSRLNGWAFDVEVLYLCQRIGWRLVEVPVRWNHADGSQLRPSAYAEVLRDVIRIRQMHRKTTIALPLPRHWTVPRQRTNTPVAVPVASVVPAEGTGHGSPTPLAGTSSI